MTSTTHASVRSLGKSGIDVFPIGLGCMSLSGAYGSSDDAAAIRLVHHAIERGVTFLDSSDMYGWGHNETLLGQALAGGKRDKVVLATKFGQIQRPGGLNGVDGSPAHVKAACDASLKRLGVEVIDLYYQHRVDPSVPIEDTVGAMGELVKAGKVRALGLSEASPETIRRAHKVHAIAAVQSEYSLLYRTDAEETLETTRALGISFVAYSPLGRSLLTGGSASPPTFPRATIADAIPALRRTISHATSSSCRRSTRWPRQRSARRARSRWPGCSRRGRTSCRSPAPSRPRASTRMSGRSA